MKALIPILVTRREYVEIETPVQGTSQLEHDVEVAFNLEGTVDKWGRGRKHPMFYPELCSFDIDYHELLKITEVLSETI